MEAPSGFGEIDPETETDFAAVLPPRRRTTPTPTQEASAPRKTPKRRSAGAEARPEAAEGSESASSGSTGPSGVSRTPERRSGASEAVTAPPRRGRKPGSSSDRLVLVAPAALRARMKATREESGKVYRDQVLDALEATVDELDELIGALNRPAVTQGKLFERVAGRAPAVASVGERRQMTIPGFTTSQFAVIDSLVESTGASSRSQLIATALERHLGAD